MPISAERLLVHGALTERGHERHRTPSKHDRLPFRKSFVVSGPARASPPPAGRGENFPRADVHRLSRGHDDMEEIAGRFPSPAGPSRFVSQNAVHDSSPGTAARRRCPPPRPAARSDGVGKVSGGSPGTQPHVPRSRRGALQGALHLARRPRDPRAPRPGSASPGAGTRRSVSVRALTNSPAPRISRFAVAVEHGDAYTGKNECRHDRRLPGFAGMIQPREKYCTAQPGRN